MLIDKACFERGCPMHENGDEYVEMVPISVGNSGDWYTIQCKDNELYIDGVCQAVNKLYLKVPKREWVGLTEYQRLKFANRFHISEVAIEAIEAKLKEKNS